MLKRDYLSWWFRPAFLRSWGNRSDTLFAGPWVGEFGWELLNWQGFLRKLSRNYVRTIVCCRKGSAALYADFTDSFVFHELRGTPEANALRESPDKTAMDALLSNIPHGANWLRPLGYQPWSRQEFIRFGTPREDLTCDIVFHPRGRGFGTDRNWPAHKWSSLIGKLHDQGYRISCIGLPGQTLDIEGPFTDYRGLPLDKTMDLLASARLVLGPSSGPMHLAALCGTPHLVWTDKGRYARGRTNRDKYEWWWNPLGTPVRVLDEDGFDPSVERVLRTVDDFISGIATPGKMD